MLKSHRERSVRKDKSKNQKSILSLGFVQVLSSLSEKSDVSSKESKERSKSKNKKTKMQSKLKDIIEVNEAQPAKENKKEMLPIKVEVKTQNEFSESNVPNYNQQFFDYKALKVTTKRRNNNTDPLIIKTSKKHSNTWIKKESNNQKSPSNSKSKLKNDSESIKSDFSEDLAIDINKTINEQLPLIEESKDPIKNINEPNPTNQTSAKPLNNTLHSFGIGRNVKVKIDKNERLKMSGHKCELCHQFYESLGENSEMLYDECSRHRTDQNINSTPKGYYDLSI